MIEGIWYDPHPSTTFTWHAVLGISSPNHPTLPVTITTVCGETFTNRPDAFKGVWDRGIHGPNTHPDTSDICIGCLEGLPFRVAMMSI